MLHYFSYGFGKEKGQGIIEYALILVLIAMVVIVVLAIFGDVLNEAYCNILTTIGGEGGAACAAF
jgi:pilus assembly protein Flp/PilA